MSSQASSLAIIRPDAHDSLEADPSCPDAFGAEHRMDDRGGRGGDGHRSWLCAISAAPVLVSILGNASLGWWWLDPIAGLRIAVVAVREAREAWAGEVCADCTPIGFESAGGCGEDGYG